ncbi:unnamed protein product [Spirodela intermedia]|uniref:Uncharacterized protein n=1 Tax=Spirodela intermedia TaxID=51605 RepID=A0A7I8LGI8_SPIIN|nr:unnamed protein product [Spirodela intermedia]
MGGSQNKRIESQTR